MRRTGVAVHRFPLNMSTVGNTGYRRRSSANDKTLDHQIT
jgi:hypothetical protein